MQKVAIITGGSQGIGAGLVAGYRRQGWAVVANARTITPSQDPEVAAVDGDVSEQATAERIVGAALGRFGRVDTLVNNAGVFISKPFTDYTADDYAVMVGVNLTGFFWLTQRVIAEMLSQGGGHVVNISAAVAEYQVASAPSVLTALTKGGLAAATRSLAVEYASRGIRVNAVSPGVIQTPMHPPESYADLGDQLPPMGRVGQISDIVDGILFLEASPYITGEILHIDGGQPWPASAVSRARSNSARPRPSERPGLGEAEQPPRSFGGAGLAPSPGPRPAPAWIACPGPGSARPPVRGTRRRHPARRAPARRARRVPARPRCPHRVPARPARACQARRSGSAVAARAWWTLCRSCGEAVR